MLLYMILIREPKNVKWNILGQMKEGYDVRLYTECSGSRIYDSKKHILDNISI